MNFQTIRPFFYLAVCVSLQTLLISILYHLPDLLNERLPLTLQDELTLDLNTQASTHTHTVKNSDSDECVVCDEKKAISWFMPPLCQCVSTEV